MWLLFAFGSAIFAGITAILAKAGVRDTDSDLVTALRTIVVLVFAWIMVGITGSQSGIREIDRRSLLFLVLSGISTGASWICYFKALQLGDVNKVVPIDKTSTILTMVLAFLFLKEPVTWLMAGGMVLIGAGTWLMIQKKESGKVVQGSRAWMIYAAGSALFASLTSILGKVGIEGVESNLGTALRTIIVLVMAWLIVFGKGKQKLIGKVDKRSLFFIAVSGVTTGMSWLCYYRALQEGQASIVVPIDKLSIVVTVFLAWIFFKEKLSAKAFVGLGLTVLGTLVLLV